MFLLSNDFWGPVELGADSRVPADALSVEVGAAQVDYLRDSLIVHNVFELDIAVDDMVAVKFLETCADLRDDIRDHIHRQMLGVLEAEVVEVRLPGTRCTPWMN